MSKDREASSGHQTRCPRCGLSLQVVARGEGPELGYDFVAWNRACKSPQLGGPSMCLARACEPAPASIDRDGDYRYNPAVEPLS